MSNALTNQNVGQLPAAFAGFVPPDGVVNNDLSEGVGTGFPHLSIKGKVFHIKDGDDMELVTNPDNASMPAQFLDVSLIKAARNMSKVFYLQNFSEDAAEKPDCFSNDGIRPDPQSESPQAQACAACPHNQWGSRQSEDGQGSGKGKACQDARRMAVALVEDLEYPMLLRVPPVTLKELAAYGKLLAKRGVPYQAVVTRIFFDHTVAFPKLQFQAVRFLTNEEAPRVKAMMDGDDYIDQIIGHTAAAAAEAQHQATGQLQGQMPQQFAQEAQATQVAQQQPVQQQQAPVQQQPGQQQPQQYQPQGGMFADAAPQTQAAPAPAPAPAAAPAKRSSRKKATPAAEQQAAPQQANNVVQMQQPQQTQVLQQGASNEGANVVNGDLAAGIDSLLSGLPDVPNV